MNEEDLSGLHKPAKVEIANLQLYSPEKYIEKAPKYATGHAHSIKPLVTRSARAESSLLETCPRPAPKSSWGCSSHPLPEP